MPAKFMFWRGHKVQRYWCMKCETQNLIKRVAGKNRWFWYCLNCGHHEHPTASKIDLHGRPIGRKVDDVRQVV